MELIKSQLASQDEIYEKISKAATNFKKSPKERVTLSYVEARLETLEHNWQSFNTGHDQLIKLIAKPDRIELEYFEEDIFNLCEEAYYTYKGELKTALLRLAPVSSTPVISALSTSCKPSGTEVKLPRIAIPTFSGTYTDWQSFHDLFVALIHKNQSLESVQKLHYLKSSLSGEAELLLRQFPITGESYAEAWNILKKRYSNKRYIANCVFKRFLGQRNLNQESAASIKQLLDTSVECLNALKMLDLPTDQWDAIVIYIIVSKLDAETHKQWEETLSLDNTDEIPNFDKFKTFLETRFRTLELLESSNKIGKPAKTRTFHTTAPTIKCAFCNESHFIYNCKEFSKQPVHDRNEFVQKQGLCFNCLAPNHSVSRCRQISTCRICHKKHHSLLHPDKFKHRGGNNPVTETYHKDQSENDHVVTTHVSRQEQPGQNVILATALVDVLSRVDTAHVFRALIDQGSQATFVTERLVQLLGLRRERISGVVSGIGEGHATLHIKYMVELKLRSRYKTTFTLQVKAYVLNSLTSKLPSQAVNIDNWPELHKLRLADPAFCTPSRVDILLGADIYSHIIDTGIVRGPSSVIAQSTHLGWIISGNISETNNTRQNIVSMHVNVTENELLKKFWELEAELAMERKPLTKDEEKCEEIYRKTTTRDTEGRYVVYLPLKETYEDVINKCGDTKKIATNRFMQLERKLLRNEKLRIEYIKVMEEYIELGHMTKATENNDSIYLPHHAVIREDKDTTKVRIVYDASAKGSNGHSLNDSLMIGPTLQPDLRCLIIRWRTHRIAIVADIVKMYRQVKVTDKHTELQRILWRDDPKKEIQSYQLRTVTFGTASAPYLAVRTLNQIAEDEGHRYPVACNILKSSFYMDDLMTGCDGVDEAVRMVHEINNLLKLGGFILQKWSSNSNELLSNMRDEREISTDNLEIKFDDIMKILGLTWDRSEDLFKFTITLPPVSLPVTKRSILSDVARLFDPFGWLAPVIVTAKIFIQRLWLCSVSWDDDLPCELISEWIEYRNNLQHLNRIQIERWFRTSPHQTVMELHGFADASMSAYAAVVYLRIVQDNGDIQTNLVAAKTKVAPLKQISVPRLELCAAVLLARLLRDVMNILDIPKERVHAWSDSMVVLSWLQSPPSRWQTFIGNRVSEIIEIIDNDKWRHVNSVDNPADIGSRGIKACELASYEIWWRGPHWLKYKSLNLERKQIPTTDLEIRKKTIQTFYIETRDTTIWERFSTLTKLKRVIAYCRRFRRTRDRTERSVYLSQEELREALESCIRNYQKEAFSDEIEQFKKGCELKKGKLNTLMPFIDRNGLLRVGGRLQKANLPSDMIHPIIIPGKNHLTTLIIRDAHHRTLHGGIQLMMNFLRTQYWIFGMKAAVRQCVRQCVVCIRHKASTQQQLMGQLPASRVNPARAFLNCGVDYAGPLQIRMSKGRGYKSTKGYICLFICMSTRAIHLEAVTDLTTQAFLAAFRRFVSRRGHCENIWSDNGTNFVGAAKELTHLLNKDKSGMLKDIAEQLSNEGTAWHFIPPRAPNFGGLWEAGVKSTKTHLTRIIGNHTLTYEELSTLLAQIEACLNSRPMYQMTNNADITPLTPGHFLIGEPIVAVPDVRYEDVNASALDRWQMVQQMTQHFWQRWRFEYLNTMQQRYKWQHSVISPVIGDIVIIKEDDLPPTKWLLAKIIQIHPGPDQKIRVVTLQSKGGSVIKRPLSKLVFLPKALRESATVGGQSAVERTTGPLVGGMLK